MKGFVVFDLPWMIERTFACVMKCSCLARDYEQLPRSAKTPITIAATATLVRRWL